MGLGYGRTGINDAGGCSAHRSEHRRPSAYGSFTATYGVLWSAGSAVMGFLYDRSVAAVIAFSVAAQLAAIPFLLKTWSSVAQHNV